MKIFTLEPLGSLDPQELLNYLTIYSVPGLIINCSEEFRTGYVFGHMSPLAV